MQPKLHRITRAELEELFKLTNMSAADAASLVGLTQWAVQKWFQEKGSMPGGSASKILLAKLAAARAKKSGRAK